MARNLINSLWQSFLQLNLYKQSSSDMQTVPKEHLATRIYICSLAIVVLIITIIFASIVRTVNKIEYSPSLTRFFRLASKYPDTIHCPCSKISIAYDAFVTTHVRFHQVCSSQFIEQAWIDMVYAEQTNASLSSNDFRTTLSFFWQVIAGLCSISNTTWTDIMGDFSASHTFNPEAVAVEVLQTQAQATLNNTIYLARTTLSRNLLAIRRIMSGNQLVSALETNFYLRYPPGNLSSSSSLKMSPRIYNNCSCLHSEGCPHPATFNDTDGNFITIPGMIADCLIMDGTLASTLECYYDQTCISLLHQSLPIIVQPLFDASNKYFTTNSTVEMLLDEIMIDEITNDIRFDLFYSQCNPAYCSYSYTHRFDALFIVTTIIGIFGGLSFVLRLIAPFIAAMTLRWRNRGISTNNLSDEKRSQQRKCKLHFMVFFSSIL
jgi:hypothetical protein